MSYFRPAPFRAALCAAVTAVAASAAPLAAQTQRALFAWSGRVDREVLLVMRRGAVETRFSGGGDDDRGRLRVGSGLPRTDGTVDLRVSRGRGSADVVQQPSARNDYTAIVRLRDDQSGAGDYQITALWQPVNGSYAGDFDRDDRDDRRDRRDRRDARRDDRRDRRNNGRGWGWGRGGRNGDARTEDTRDDGRWGRDEGGYEDRGTGSRGGWGGILGQAGASTTGSATGALRWSGRVDDVQEVRIRGRRANAYTVSGGSATDVRTSVSGSGLPARDVTVRVRSFDGRGRVYVVEQPSARNDYTAVLRVEDRQGGAGFYDFEASWY